MKKGTKVQKQVRDMTLKVLIVEPKTLEFKTQTFLLT